MAKKYLPIQFFEKRKDYDDRSTEGGRNPTIPSWVLTGKALAAKAELLSNSVSELTEVFHERQEKERRLPMVVCTTLDEKAIAKSHRGEITGLYVDSHGSNVVGFAGDRCLLTMVSSEEVLHRIGNAVNDTEGQAKLISAITDIEPFYPAVDCYDENVRYYTDVIDKTPRPALLAWHIMMPKETDYTMIKQLFSWCRNQFATLHDKENCDGIDIYPLSEEIKLINCKSEPTSLMSEEKKIALFDAFKKWQDSVSNKGSGE